MNEQASSDAIRFYFSFRSPYAWIAAERLESELGELGVPIERVPIYPRPDLFPNDPGNLPDKMAYLIQDVPRLARSIGQQVQFPSASDTDWALPHAAFLGVAREVGGQRFMVEVFRKRFTEGLDVGDESVVADAARNAGLDADTVLSHAHSADLRTEVENGWEKAMRDDHVFGVPSFLYAGKLYWGQDRMHFLRSAVERKHAASA